MPTFDPWRLERRENSKLKRIEFAALCFDGQLRQRSIINNPNYG